MSRETKQIRFAVLVLMAIGLCLIISVFITSNVGAQ